MKKLSTRILAFLLTLAMVLSYVPGVAQTARAVEEETTPVVETAPEETAEPVSEKEEPTEAAEPEVEETTEVTAPAEEEAPADEELIGETVAFDEVVVYAAADADFDTKISGLSGTYKEPSANKPGTVEITAEMNEQSGTGSIEIQLQGYNAGSRTYSESTTVTLTNTTDSEYILAFDYDAAVSQKNNKEYIKLDGDPVANADGLSTSGGFTKTLQPGESVVIEMAVYNRTNNQNFASIKLKNIAFAKNADVTTKFLKAENGTYTVSYGDTTVTITEDTEITNKVNVGYKLAATPAEGYAFAGWYDYNKNIYVGGGAISENVRFTDETAVAQVAPLFVKTADAVYGVGEACFMDFDAAMTYATSGDDKLVVLLQDAALTAGSYEVPAGVTLLIPFDDKNTCYTENPGTTSSKNNKVAWVTPYAYRTLTLESGAELVVKGYVSISAKHSAGPEATAGSPTGPFGHVVMADNSKITLEKDAALYAWGYITGSGDVIAKSGSEVWENIQIADFRGGGASVTMVPTKADDPLIEEKKVFPFSQYYVQNIEVALTIYSGASEKVSSTLYALDDTYPTPGIEFIGGDTAMFQLGEGSYIVKDYDNTTDRLNLSAHGTGNMSVNSLSVEMAGTGLNSSMFNLPITSNITINAMGGNTTINQDVALMPGSEVYIAKGATLTMGSGYNVFVYDLDDWSKGTAHVLVGMDGETPVYELKPVTGCNFVHNNVKVRPVAFSPAGKATRTANSLVDAKVDVNGTLNVEGFLYTTSGGANITSSKGTGKILMNNEEIGSADHTNQVTQSGTDVTYVDIAITPAKLKNADGSFTESDSIAPMSEFYYENGKWVGKNSYTVTFDGNGAEGTVDPMEVTFTDVYWEENSIELPENAFTMKYGEFLGWDTDKDIDEPSYWPEDLFEVTEDVTLYAIWKITPPASHTITWVIDGKSTETSWYEGETPVYNGETPTKAADGCTTYTFAGWATSADGDVLETIPAATDAATYYAIFTAATNHSFTTKPGSVKTPGNCQTEAVHYVQCDNCDAESETMTVKGKKDKNNHVTPDNFTYVDHWGYHEKNYACCGTQAAKEACTYNDHFVPIDHGERHRAYCICGGYYIQDHTLQEDNYCKCGAFATYLDFNGGKNNADPSLTGMYEWWDPMFGNDNRYNLSEENLDKINSNFSKDGYRIIGYAYDAEGTNMYVSEAPLTGPTTLYMIWECVHETTKAVDNNDGETHNLICANPECNAVLGENVAHDYSKNDEHKCECGVVEKFPMNFYLNQGDETPAATIMVPFGTVLKDENGYATEEMENLAQQATDSLSDTPTKDHYEFNGWETWGIREFTMPAETVSVYALWNTNEYTIKWDLNGGEFKDYWIDAPESVYYNWSIMVMTASHHSEIFVEKEGYTFSHFVDQDGNEYNPVLAAVGGDMYQWQVGKMPGKNITLTAVWEAAKYKVTFTVNGETYGVPVEVKYGEAITAPTYTVPEGYTFSGWEVPATMPAKDLTLDATLTVNTYKVTFTINGEAYGEPVEVKYGEAITAPTYTVPEGHTFSGWTLPATMPAKDLTLDATLTANTYKVTFTVNGEAYGVPVEVKYGEAITAPTYTVPEGYTFSGWDVPATMPAKDLTLDATLTANTYKVTFTVNGEAYGVPVEVKYGEAITAPTFTVPEGHTFSGWDVPATMPAKDLTLDATLTANTYKVTFTINGETYGEPVEVKFGATITAPDYTVPTGYTFSGWTLPETMPAENITLDAKLEINTYTLTIQALNFRNGNGFVNCPVEVPNVPYGANIKDYIPADCGETWSNAPIYKVGDQIVVDGSAFKGTWTITGWNSWSEEDGYQTIDIATATMPEGDFAVTQDCTFTGWEFYDEGTMYCVDHDYYRDTIAHIDGEAYLFDENGYIVAGAGLVRFVTEDGTVEYYYFCDGYCEDSDEACKFREPSYTAFKEGVHWVYNDNDLLPNWDYTFDDRGVILHHQDTSLNGLHDQGEDTIYYIDGVPVYMGLMYNQEEDYYYYIRSSGKMVKSQTYWISKTNGLPVEEKAYLFDADGHMYLKDPNLKNGIIAENGGLYYYVDGKLTYAGLIEIDGDLYYVRSNGQLVQSQKYWISKTNGLKPEGSYHFDAEGKLYIPEPVVEIVDGYYYVDGKLTYAGLIEIDGDLYYVRSNGQLVKGQWYWVSKTNGLKPEGSYEFDAEGRLIEDEDRFTGIKDGYYYVNGVKTYAGLVEIDGELYYINSSCQVVTGRKYWISKTNGLKPEGSYTFDATGKLIG